MSGRLPGDDDAGRLQRCIRDLVALQALPSMCVGRSSEAALAIVIDALPTVLQCSLVYLALPGATAARRGSLDGQLLTAEELNAIEFGGHVDSADGALTCRDRKLWCMYVDVPLGEQSGRLVVGRDTPLDRETDRVLFRSAANLIGTTLEGAFVLEAARRKDDFIAMLGHELRNPLASILTAVELLARQTAAREREVIEHHTKHLARLVDDLLDVTRVTRGHIEIRREPVRLRAILDRAGDIATPLLRANGLTLRRMGDDSAVVDGDAVRLTQVFGNLLTNAAKFAPRGGAIDVTVHRGRERVRVAVRDEGRGIARENLGRIFEPFVQVDRSHEVTSQGLGLGLAIVRTLVERHGGTITAESEGLGRGSTFVVDLPTTSAAPISQPMASPTTTPAGRTGFRVLLVDDSADIADLLSLALSTEGFDTATEYDAHRALERWATFRPHAAILDVGLPHMDGYELARTIRARHGTRPTLVAATGYGQPEDRQRALEAGFDLHLTKPVSLDDLIRVLDERVVAAAGNGGSELSTYPPPG